MASGEDRIEYPFSKTILYINSIIAFSSAIFSLYLLYNVSEDTLSSIAAYTVLLFFVTAFSFKLKLYTIRKMLSKSSEPVFNQHPRRGLIDRNFLILFILAAIMLFSPIVLWYLFGSYISLLYLAVYVVGFSLSEPLVYIYCNKKG